MTSNERKIPLQFALILLGLTLGCQSASGTGTRTPTDPAARERIRVKPGVATPVESHSLAAQIEAILGNADPKDFTSVTFSNAPPVDTSQNQRILILDTGGAPPSALLRYRHRVLAFEKLILTDAGPAGFEEWAPRGDFSTAVIQASDLLADAPYHVPVENLDSDLLRQRLKSLNKIRNLNFEEITAFHVGVVFDSLADLNPSAQFVLAEAPMENLSKTVYCDFERDGVIDRLRSRLAQTSLSLAGIVDHYGITHINISYLPSRDTLATDTKMICGRDLDSFNSKSVEDLLSAFASFYENLQNLKGVLVFKSLPNDPAHELNPANPADELDCTPYPGFIHVGFFEKALSNVSYQGAAYSNDLVYPSQRLNRACADLFVNSGFEGDNPSTTGLYGPRPFRIKKWGLTIDPSEDPSIDVMSTSWATPLALSYAIRLESDYLDANGALPTEAEFRELLNQSGSRPLVDPLFFHQFELYAQ